VRDKRPVNLNLMTMAFPLPAIVSILHRISGVILFLLIPTFLILLSCSLQDAYGFYHIVDFLNHPLAKLVLFATFLALFYHLIAGIRHLFMDFHCGDSLAGGRIGAKLVIAATIIFAIFLGIWLWYV
jgi:succinate dehydrogenase / fumarate reductase, cytochrome b subunit